MVAQLYVNNNYVSQLIVPSTSISVWNKFSSNFNATANPVNAKISLKIFYANVTGTAPNYTYTLPTGSGLDYLFLLDDISVRGCMPTTPFNSIACDIPAAFEMEPEDDVKIIFGIQPWKRRNIITRYTWIRLEKVSRTAT